MPSRVTIRGVTNSTQPTGLDLKIQRVRAGVRVKDIAHAMGVGSSRISAIERSDVLRQETVVKYLSALVTCGTTRTSRAA